MMDVDNGNKDLLLGYQGVFVRRASRGDISDGRAYRMLIENWMRLGAGIVFSTTNPRSSVLDLLVLEIDNSISTF